MITDDETKNFTSLNLDTLNSRKNDVDIFRQLINQEPSSHRSWSRLSTPLSKIRRLGKKNLTAAGKMSSNIYTLTDHEISQLEEGGGGL